MKYIARMVIVFIILTAMHAQAQQWLGSANSTGLLYRADKVKVGSGPLFLDWTYQNNWGGSANLWAGYIGFNAYRNNNDIKDMYVGDNQYTSKLVFEGSNTGFRWLYRAPVGNDSHLQHALSELMTLNSLGNLGVGTAIPLGKATLQSTVASGGVAYPLSLSALAPDAASGSGVGLSFFLGGNNTEAQRSEQVRITVKQTYYGVRPSFSIQMKDYNAPYEQFFDRFLISPQGNVGIGTSSPSAKVQINGNGAGTTVLSIIENQQSASGAHFVSEGANNIKFQLVRTADGVANTELLTYGNSYINAISGNVGIGTTTPDAKLAVKGTIHSQEVKVDMLGSMVPDYVFESTYRLPSLESIKTYIDQHKHLPEVPSAKEMEANGINLGEMNMLLLKKIEELTLYVIELKEEMKLLKNEN